MSKTLIFLQQQKISSADELKECADAALSRYHELGDSIKTSEKRLAEIAVLKAHIINYAKTRPVYDAYRKAGYSKKFLEEHCTEITLHKAAKAAFDESNLKTLPKIKELDAEYSKLLTEKKARYPDYRKARDEMQELLQAQKNIELAAFYPCECHRLFSAIGIAGYGKTNGSCCHEHLQLFRTNKFM